MRWTFHLDLTGCTLSQIADELVGQLKSQGLNPYQIAGVARGMPYVQSVSIDRGLVKVEIKEANEYLANPTRVRGAWVGLIR